VYTIRLKLLCIKKHFVIIIVMSKLTLDRRRCGLNPPMRPKLDRRLALKRISGKRVRGWWLFGKSFEDRCVCGLCWGGRAGASERLRTMTGLLVPLEYYVGVSRVRASRIVDACV
jgi:hypothetical protein